MLSADPKLAEGVQACRMSSPITTRELPEGAWGLVAELLRSTLGRNVLVVAADPQALIDDLAAFDGIPAAFHYPAADVLPMDRTPPSDEIVAARLPAPAPLRA